MKKSGVLLIALGVFSAYLAFNMDVVVGTSYNIGLLNNRQNIVYLSGILFLAGIILFGFGVIAKEKINLISLVGPAVLTSLIAAIGYMRFLGIEQANLYASMENLHASTSKTTAVLSFTDNKDGTITFNSTGLTWMKCSVGQTWTGETCIGQATKMTWNEAMKLSVSFAGHNDWRLPIKEELMTLVFCSDGEYGEDGSCKNMTDVTHPAINSMYFPNTEVSSYWSSSPYANGSDFAWYINFFDGYSGYGVTGSGNNNGNSYSFVRLVR
jgi:hypothetical protein